MHLARVIGTVVSTSKNPALVGMKMLIVQRLNELLEPSGRSEVAVDSVDAGIGDLVLVLEGSSARRVFGDDAPVDKAIVGIVNSVEVG